ncbi:hypothetical protein E4U17_001327 [Claviceps sp. LM77 group G4]|nr:hypothetical protein E4U17_001327 [Claviceps sp. LM77 group G4]KAG6074913.1 hypothetical protein E4U16_003695 [Claviceps sp. LM84 group G4]
MKDTLPQPYLGFVPENLPVTAEHLGQCDTFPTAKGASQLHGMALFMANAAAFIEHSFGFEKRSKAMQLLQGGFAEMCTEFRVTDLNSSRRMQNSIVVDEDKPLEALYSMRTGRLIPDFPKNLRALDALPAQCVDAILIELEHSVEGRLPDRRRRLDHALGVKRRSRLLSRANARL